MGPRKDLVLYIGHFALPDRNAGAVRVQGIADALTEAGYSVHLIGRDDEYHKLKRNSGQLGRLAAAFRSGVDHFVSARSFLRRLNLVEWDRLAAVICYPGPSALVWRLMRLCRRRRVPFVLDIVEWYDPSHTPFGRFGPFAFDSELRMRCLYRRAGKLICISSYLARQYAAKGCRVLRVPPLIGPTMQWKGGHEEHEQSGQCITLAYAGSPGRKELFAEIVTAVQSTRRRGINVQFSVVGVTEGEMIRMLERSALMDGIRCFGRVPRDAALQVVASSDFSVILRPQERFANAGFPTKFVESLSLGVPVIANATSDLAEYLVDGREGYLLAEPTASALEHALARAGERTPEQRSQMRMAARLRFEESFDARKYAGVLAEFLGEGQE